MITKEMVDRINSLARKSKAEGLSEEETKEQQKLRRAYIDAYKSNLEAQLSNTYIVRPDGTKEKVTKKK